MALESYSTAACLGCALGAVALGYMAGRYWHRRAVAGGAEAVPSSNSPRERSPRDDDGDRDDWGSGSDIRSGHEDNGPLLEGMDPNEEVKLVLVARTDLKMGKGKMAAQCCHGAVAAYEQSANVQRRVLHRWLMNGQAKVVLKVDSQEKMLELRETARAVGLLANLVRDAGRTQIAAGSCTVLAVGPGPKSLVDSITGHLKLM